MRLEKTKLKGKKTNPMVAGAIFSGLKRAWAPMGRAEVGAFAPPIRYSCKEESATVEATGW